MAAQQAPSPQSNQLQQRGVVFSHAVNSEAELSAALACTAVNFLETDVILASPKTPGAEPDAVLGHDPGAKWDLDLAGYTDTLFSVPVGVKLDFKQAAALEVAGLQLAALAKSSVLPSLAWGEGAPPSKALLINADVLPADAPCLFLAAPGLSPEEFGTSAAEAHTERVVSILSKALCSAPGAALSLGWTTCTDTGTYSDEDVLHMVDLVARLRAAVGQDVPVTYAVRGTWVRRSWGALERLLAATAPAGCTVWSRTTLPAADEQWMRDTMPHDRSMLDLPS